MTKTLNIHDTPGDHIRTKRGPNPLKQSGRKLWLCRPPPVITPERSESVIPRNSPVESFGFAGLPQGSRSEGVIPLSPLSKNANPCKPLKSPHYQRFFFSRICN